ncbi:MAG: FtsX-like permease family protein, partial [Humibacter sp.]
QRRSVAREGVIVGAVGALIGVVVAVGLALLTVTALTSGGELPDLAYPVVTPSLIAPPVVVVLTTWLSSWVGSRRVLSVSPIQALGAAEERPVERVRSRGRAGIATALILSGAVLLALGLAAGLGVFAGSSIRALALSSHYALVAGLLGGVLSFTGIILAAPAFMPFILRLIGRLLGRGAAGRLAAANAVRHPERSSRTAIGLVIGVTLITMFVVAASTWMQMITAAAAKEPGEYAGAANILAITMSVFSTLVGFSAVIAAVGVVNSLSLSVLQRTRELGLLRALGFSRQQVRRMILAESVQLTISAVVTGLILGTAYGWIGAQTLLGSIPAGGLLPPAMPWQFILLIAGLTTALALIASVAPTRQATRVSPVTALAVE